MLFLTQRIPLTVIRWTDAVIEKRFGIYVLTLNPFVHFCLVSLSALLISYCIVLLFQAVQMDEVYLLKEYIVCGR